MLVLRSTHEREVAQRTGELISVRGELERERTARLELADRLAAAFTATESERELLASVARNLHTAILDATAQATSLLGKELAATRLELTRERARRELLDTQLKIAQKDADWLRVLVNTANTERAAAFAQSGVAVPVPTIRPFTVPMGTAPTRPEPPAEGTTTGTGLPGPLQEMLDGGLMEDMGDEAAARAGLNHDEHGGIHFGPLTA